jgi:hypothetical protein
MLVVSNMGAESVAKQWAAYIYRPGGKRIQLAPLFQDAPIDDEGIRLLPENNIVTKTSRLPIPRGAGIHGHLLAVSKLTPAQLLEPGWSLVITCEDVRGAETQAETPILGNNPGAVLHPGL